MLNVDFYHKKNGECPVEEYLNSLSPKLRAKTLRSIMLLEEFGCELRMPYSRLIGEGIFEFERAFFLEKKEGAAIFVHRHQMRRQAFIIQVGLPVVGAGRSNRYDGEGQGQRQPHQQPGHGRAKRRRNSGAAGKPGSGLSGPDRPAPCV